MGKSLKNTLYSQALCFDLHIRILYLWSIRFFKKHMGKHFSLVYG